MDDVINEVRYRLPLKTTNWREAKRSEKENLAEIAEGKFGSVGKIARQSFRWAADAYVAGRKLHSAEKTRSTDEQRSRPLEKFWGDCEMGLSDMTATGIAGHVSREILQHYSHIRLDAKRKALEGLETRIPTVRPTELQTAQRPN
jgi:hypothetical protein